MDCEVSCEPVTVDTGVEGGHHGFVHGDDLLQSRASVCWNKERQWRGRET